MHTIPPIALKEWAVAVKALEEGKQIILMRKGGIKEETRDFRLQSRFFCLFPTYEHQQEHLIKEENQPMLERTLQEWPQNDQQWPIAVFAEAVADFEINEPEQLQALAAEHIWTDAFAEERLRWKRKQPLHVLALRVYRLAQPIVLPMLDAYGGCKSWIELEGKWPEAVEAEPVLSDETFGRQLQQIKHKLGAK